MPMPYSDAVLSPVGDVAGGDDDGIEQTVPDGRPQPAEVAEVSIGENRRLDLDGQDQIVVELHARVDLMIPTESAQVLDLRLGARSEAEAGTLAPAAVREILHIGG